MHKHGQQLQLQTMRLRSIKELSVPPSSKHQHLVLSSCDLECSTVCISISTATALTSMHINKCRLVVQRQLDVDASKAQLLAALAPLTALQELSWCGVVIHTTHPASTSSALQPSTAILQPMQHLTQLQLDIEQETLADGVVQHIGSMTDLQDLRLGGVKGAPLKLAVKHLTRLTKLRQLGLRGASLESGTPAESAANAAALLAWLPRLQELSNLQLRAVDNLSAGLLGDEALYPPATAYRALTAGSVLRRIDLRGTCLNQDAWQRAFPLVRQHTSSTSLRFGEHGLHRTQFYFQFTVGSCPDLRELQTTGDRIGTSSWQLLQQPTGLTRLTVIEADWDSFAHISQLTQLESLQLLGLSVRRAQCIHVFLPDLRQLAPLTRLSSMRLEVRDLHRPDMEPAAFEQLCIVFDSVGTAELWEEHQPGGRCAARGIWGIVSKVGWVCLMWALLPAAIICITPACVTVSLPGCVHRAVAVRILSWWYHWLTVCVVTSRLPARPCTH